jgi:hypothetical protein
MYCGCSVDAFEAFEVEHLKCAVVVEHFEAFEAFEVEHLKCAVVVWLYMVLWMYCGCTVDVLWIYCGCTVDLLWMYCGCTLDY